MCRLTLSLLVLLLIVPVTLADETETKPETKPETEKPWQTSINDVAIPMRDGKSLAGNILLPEKRGEYPCILVQTPYNKDRMGREYGDTEKKSEVARGSDKAWSQFDRENYAYVFVDWRGFYGSKAAMKGVSKRKWKRGYDGFDTVEWIAEQTWCNGKIGTWGGSALGKQQFDTAAEQPPHLVCAAPLIAYQGMRYEGYYEGGVALDAHVKALDFLGFGVGKLVKDNPQPNRLWKFVANQTYHPEKIKVPCLMISGWWDNYPRDILSNYADLLSKGKGKAQDSKLIMGPWSHTAIDVTEQGDLKFPKAESWSTKVTLQFFDYYLRGIEDSGWSEVAKVSAFQCHEGEWVTGDSWDKLTGKDTTWKLYQDGTINTKRPAVIDKKVYERKYIYDPKSPSPTIGGQNLPPLTHGPKELSKIAKRKDVLVYATDTLPAPVAIRGEVELTVHFRANRVDTDIHVRLCDEDADGKLYLVGETIQRAKLRGDAVELLEPDKAYSLTLRFPPHAYTWQKDHKLKLIITGGNAPRYEPNTHTGADHFEKSKALDVDVSILHAMQYPTAIRLPLVK